MQYNKNIPHNNRSKIDELLLSVASNLDHRKGDVDEFRVYASQYFLKKI
jgi:hypothetical protein